MPCAPPGLVFRNTVSIATKWVPVSLTGPRRTDGDPRAMMRVATASSPLSGLLRPCTPAGLRARTAAGVDALARVSCSEHEHKRGGDAYGKTDVGPVTQRIEQQREVRHMIRLQGEAMQVLSAAATKRLQEVSRAS